MEELGPESRILTHQLLTSLLAVMLGSFQRFTGLFSFQKLCPVLSDSSVSFLPPFEPLPISQVCLARAGGEGARSILNLGREILGSRGAFEEKRENVEKRNAPPSPIRGAGEDYKKEREMR